MGKITRIKEKETGKLRTIKDYDPITGGYINNKLKSQGYFTIKDSAAYIRDNFDFIDE